jgi:dipeptidyl aminopeptidase/acylaminoacyl peptidase
MSREPVFRVHFRGFITLGPYNALILLSMSHVRLSENDKKAPHPLRAFPHNLALTGVAAYTITLIIISCNNHALPPSSVTISGIPPIPTALRQSLTKYQNWDFAALQDWGPGGTGMVVVSRVKEINQIHFVADPGKAPRQLTFSSEPVTSVAVCPAPGNRTMLFTRDSGGNENFQIYAMRVDSPSPVRLTDGTSQNDGIAWSNAGEHFAFQSNRRNGTDFDIYVSDACRPSEARPVVTRTGSWSVLDWSPDDSLLLVSHYLSRTASYLYILDPRSGRCEPLTDTTDTVSQELGAWGPLGAGIFLTSDKGTDFRTLRYYDCATKHDTILTADIPWDVRELSLSRDRSLLAFQTNQHGYAHLYIMNTATFRYRDVPNLPLGGIHGLRFDPSARWLGMTITTERQPEDAYAVRLADFSLVRWTHSTLGGLDSARLVSPSLITYSTFDSVGKKPRAIPCFVYKPTNPRGPLPVLINIHGGPESQFWPYFSPSVQFDVNELGLCVLAPNVRGSGGYGKTYLSLDNGYKREDAVKDIGALLDWIGTQPDLDSSHIGVFGGSYGGYMALASMIRYAGRIRAGIDLYGISNFITFLEQTAPYRRDLRRAEYGDERDPRMRAFLSRISPLTNASAIAAPLLIVQGANDPRVPLGESRHIADAVKKNGGTVWLLVAGDEGHGFRKKSNQDYQEGGQALFLQSFLVR